MNLYTSQSLISHKERIFELLRVLGLEEAGSGLMQTVQAVDMPCSAKGWKGLSLQIHGSFGTVLLHYIVPLRLTRLAVLAIANLLASFRSM